MNKSEIMEILKIKEYEENNRKLRKEFREQGVRFYDRYGTGFIRNKVKNYTEKY